MKPLELPHQVENNEMSADSSEEESEEKPATNSQIDKPTQENEEMSQPIEKVVLSAQIEPEELEGPFTTAQVSQKLYDTTAIQEEESLHNQLVKMYGEQNVQMMPPPS